MLAPPNAMIILCWNVRGLGNTWTFKALAKVLRLYKPNILFLCETKRNALQMEKIKIKLTFDIDLLSIAVDLLVVLPYSGIQILI